MIKQISTEMTKANIERILELLAETPSQLLGLSDGLDGEKLSRPFALGERSFLETLAHLIHCEDRSAAAIYSALLVHEPLMLKIHPERQLGKLLSLDQLTFTDLLTYFTLRRQIMWSVLAGLNDRQWQRVIREEGKKRKESVYWQARGLALHEQEHLLDLDRKLNAADYNQ